MNGDSMRVAALLVLLVILPLIPAYGEEVQVFNYSTYINSKGEPVVTGEVINASKVPVGDVEVRIRSIDAADKTIGYDIVTTALASIPPGQRAPFALVGSADNADIIKGYDLEVSSFTRTNSKPAVLEITSASEFSDGITEIAIGGEIANNGGDFATSVIAHATFYDEWGKVVGYSSTLTSPGIIEPGGTGSFMITMNEKVGSISSYMLVAEAEEYSAPPYGLQSVSMRLEFGDSVDVSSLSAIDQDGNPTGKLMPGQESYIKAELENMLSVTQGFTYIAQIKDADGFPVAIRTQDGLLLPSVQQSVSVPWVPEHEGIYFAEIFVWDDLDSPTPLSVSIKIIILYVSASENKA